MIFKVAMQFGPNSGQKFQGNVYEKYSDETQNSGIFLIPADKLIELNKKTLEMIRHDSIVITDSSLDVD